MPQGASLHVLFVQAFFTSNRSSHLVVGDWRESECASTHCNCITFWEISAKKWNSSVLWWSAEIMGDFGEKVTTLLLYMLMTVLQKKENEFCLFECLWLDYTLTFLIWLSWVECYQQTQLRCSRRLWQTLESVCSFLCDCSQRCVQFACRSFGEGFIQASSPYSS